MCVIFIEFMIKYVVKYLICFFLITHGYTWISMDIKKMCRLTNTRTNIGIEHIFIPRVEYEGATICIIPVPLTSLIQKQILVFSSRGTPYSTIIQQSKNEK